MWLKGIAVWNKHFTIWWNEILFVEIAAEIFLFLSLLFDHSISLSYVCRPHMWNFSFKTLKNVKTLFCTFLYNTHRHIQIVRCKLSLHKCTEFRRFFIDLKNGMNRILSIYQFFFYSVEQFHSSPCGKHS